MLFFQFLSFPSMFSNALGRIIDLPSLSVFSLSSHLSNNQLVNISNNAFKYTSSLQVMYVNRDPLRGYSRITSRTLFYIFQGPIRQQSVPSSSSPISRSQPTKPVSVEAISRHFKLFSSFQFFLGTWKRTVSRRSPPASWRPWSPCPSWTWGATQSPRSMLTLLSKCRSSNICKSLIPTCLNLFWKAWKNSYCSHILCFLFKTLAHALNFCIHRLREWALKQQRKNVRHCSFKLWMTEYTFFSFLVPAMWICMKYRMFILLFPKAWLINCCASEIIRDNLSVEQLAKLIFWGGWES